MASINVSNVTMLHTWQAEVDYNASNLQFLNVTEGEFLKQAGKTQFFYAMDDMNGTLGPINATLLESTKGANDSGQLATLYFRVRRLGDSDLSVSEKTKMLDSEGRIISTSKVYSLPGLGSYLDKTGYLYGNTVLLILLLAIIAAIVLSMEGLIWRRLLRKFEKYHMEV